MEVVKEQTWACKCAFCDATLLVSSKDIKSDIGSESAHAKTSIIKSGGVSYYRYYKCGVCGRENDFTADVLTR